MLRYLFAFMCLSSLAFADSHPTTKANPKEQTLSIIKPNSVADNDIGEIITRFEEQGLRVAAIRMTKLSLADAEKFYAAHKERPFFKELTTFMSSGPIVAVVLEGEDAVAKSREIMGATDPQKAAEGTIRADFGESITKNSVHGSDSQENAKTEISFFFKPSEIY